MKIFVETERLILRELLPEDENGMWELDSDPEVHKYVGNKPVTNMEQVRAVIAIIRQQYTDNGIARWAMIEKSTNNFMGWTGLKLIKEATGGHANYFDLGYRMARKYWGQGFATESAIASLGYGFAEMGIQEFFARANIDNLASQNVLKKSGMNLVKQIYVDGAEHYWYHLTREEWERKKLMQEEQGKQSDRPG